MDIHDGLARGTLGSRGVAPHLREDVNAPALLPESIPPLENESTDLSFKEFLQLNCDKSIIHTNYARNSLDNWASILEQYVGKNDDWRTTDLDPEVVEKAQTFLTQLQDTTITEASNDASVWAAVESYKEDIAALETNGEMAIPGGFHQKGANHAVIYLVKRTGINTYSFSIVNTGIGTDFHASKRAGLKTKILPTLEYVNLSLDNDLSADFLFSLFKLSSSIKKDAFDPKQIYQILFENFKYSEQNSDQVHDDFIMAQASDTCALKSTLAVLYKALGKEAYKDLMFYISYESVYACAVENKFDEALRGNTQKDFEARALAKTAATTLMSKCTKQLLKNKGKCKLPAAPLLAGKLLEKIKKAESDNRELHKSATAEFYSPHAASLEVSPQDEELYAESVPSENLQVAYDLFIPPTIRSQNDFNLTNIKETLAKYEDNASLQRAFIEALVDNTPLPEDGSQFWNLDGSTARGKVLLSTFNLLMTTYYKITVNNHISGRQRNTTHALYVFTHGVIKQIEPEVAEFMGRVKLDEADPAQLFLSKTELARHNEIAEYEKEHLDREITTQWDIPPGQIDLQDLPDDLKYFWQQCKRNQAAIIEEGERRNPITVESLRYMSEGERACFNQDASTYYFLKAFASVETRPANPFTVAPVFREMQKATFNILGFEKYNTRYDYRPDCEVTGLNLSFPYFGGDISVSTYKTYNHEKLETVGNLKDEDRRLERCLREYQLTELPEVDQTNAHLRALVRHSPSKELLTKMLFFQAIANSDLRSINLLSWTTRFFDLFDDPLNRTLFEHQFYKTASLPGEFDFVEHGSELAKINVLEEDLDSKNFRDEFISFLKNQQNTLLKNVNDQNLSQVLFSIRTATTVLNFAKEYGSDEDFQTELTKHIRLCFKETPLGNLRDSENQALVHLHRAYFQSTLMIHNSGTTKDDIRLLDAWIRTLKASARLETDYELNHIFTITQERVTSQIPAILKRVEENQQLQVLAQRVFGAPDFTCNRNKYSLEVTNPDQMLATVCFATGVVVDFTGTRYEAISRAALNSEDFATEIWGRDLSEVKITEGIDSLNLLFQDGKFRVTRIDSHTLEIHKEINGDLCKFISREDLFKHYNVSVTSKGITSEKIPVSILQSCIGWIKDKDTMYFVDRETGKLKYTHGQNGLTNKRNTKVRKCLQNSLISSIEFPEFTHIETNESGKQILHIPRYENLSFVKVGEKWHWQQDNTYFLVTRRSKGQLGPFEGYLYLKSNSGQEVALVPDVEFQADSSHNLNLFLSVTRTAIINDNQKDSLTYTAIPLKEGKFAPTNSDQIASCAFVCLAMKQYEDANTYISNLSLLDVQTSDKIQDKLLKLATLANNLIETPEAIGIALKAIYLASRTPSNTKLLDKTSAAIQNTLEKTYAKYLTLISSIPERFRVTHEQEFKIVEFCPQQSSLRTHHIDSNDHSLDDTASFSALSTPDNPEFTFLSRDEVPCPAHSQARPSALDSLDLKTYQDMIKNPADNLGILFETVVEISQEKRTKPVEYQETERALALACMLTKTTSKYSLFLYKVLTSTSFTPHLEWAFEPDPVQPTTSYTNWKGEKVEVVDTRSLQIRISLGKSNWLDQLQRTYPMHFSGKSTIDIEPQVVDHKRHRNVVDEMRHRTTALHTPEHMTHPRALQLQDPRADNLKFSGSVPNILPYQVALAEIKTTLSQTSTLFIPYSEETAKGAASVLKDEDMRDADGNRSDLEISYEYTRDQFLEAHDKMMVKRNTRKLPVLSVDQINSEIITKYTTIKAEKEAQLKILEEKLLALANKCEAQHKVLKSSIEEGGIKEKITITELIYLFFGASQEAYLKANPFLERDDAQEIYNQSANYFHQCIESDQLIRLIKKATELRDEMTKRGLNSTEDLRKESEKEKHPTVVEFLSQLAEIGKQNSQYDYTADPSRLVFEYATKLMMRTEPDQFSTLEFILNKLKDGGNCTIGMQMGGGKTSVLATYFLSKLLGKDNIPILLTPEFQFPTLCSTLRDSLKSFANIEIVTLKNSRQDLGSIEKLKENLELLKEIQASPSFLSPKVLVICPEAVQTLELRFIELLGEIEKTMPNENGEIVHNDDYIKQAEILRNILKLLKENGIALGDEVHHMLDIITELNFPIGKEMTPDDKKIDLLQIIMGVVNNEEFREAFKISTNQTKKCFTQEEYRKEGGLLDSIINILMDVESLDLQPEHIEPFSRYVKGTIHPDVQRFVNEGEGLPGDRHDDRLLADFLFVQELDRWNKERDIDPVSASSADLIALSKNILDYLLPHILCSKTANENYGRTRNPERIGEVVPYKCLDTPTKNKFGSSYEAIIYHFLTAMTLGVVNKQIDDLFTEYLESDEQYQKKRGFTTGDTPPVKECRNLFDGKHPRDYFQKDEDGSYSVRDQIRIKVQNDTDLLFKVEAQAIRKFVKEHPNRLNSNAMSIVTSFKSFVGMSGTPTEGLLHHSLQGSENRFIDDTVNPAVIHGLMSKNREIGILDNEDTTDLISKVAKANDNSHGLLDLGSHFIDLDNDQVAKKLLAELHNTRGIDTIVYFTRDNGSEAADFPAVLRFGEGRRKVIKSLTKDVLKAEGLKAGEFFLFLDKRHCTGIDAPATPNATYSILWGKDISLDDGTQGTMRLRQFLNGQNVHLLLPKSEAKIMLPNKKPAPGEEPASFEDLDTKEQYVAILRNLLFRQAYEISRKKLKSFRKMLTNAVTETVKECLMTNKITESGSHWEGSRWQGTLAWHDSLNPLKQLVQAGSPFLFVRSEINPFTSFGSLKEAQPVLTALRNEQDGIIKSFSTSLRNAGIKGNQRQLLLGKIRTEHQKILTLAKETEAEFLRTVEKDVQKMELAEGDDETEVETLEEVFEAVVEQEIELEKEIEEEVNKLQQNIHLTPLTYHFDALEFLYQQKHDLESSASPMGDNFSARYNPPGYRRGKGFENTDFTKIFSKNLFVTEAHRQPYKQNISFFQRNKPNPEYLLFVRLPNGEHKAIVVAQKEARALKEEISRNPEEHENVWLVNPSSMVIAGKKESLDLKNESVRSSLQELNILSGNLSYCLRNLGEYLEWLAGGDDQERLSKELFVQLAIKKHASIHGKDINHLGSKDLVEKLLMQDELYNGKNIYDDITPEEIQTWTGRKKARVPLLRKVEQIRALPEEFRINLCPKQVEYLTTEEAITLIETPEIARKKKRYIRHFTEKMVGELKPESVTPEFISSFTQTQYGYITQPELLKHVKPENIPSLKPEMTPHLGTQPGLVSRLTDEQMQYATLGQLKSFIKDPAGTKRLKKVKEASVLSELVKAGFRRITQQQLRLITDESILLLFGDKLIHQFPKRKVATLENTKLIARLSAKQAAWVNPDLVNHLNDDAFVGIDSRLRFRKLSRRNLLKVNVSQIEMADPKQYLTYLVFTTANAFFSAIVFIPVGIMYLLQKVIKCHYFDSKFKFVKRSVRNYMALVRHIGKRVLCCNRNFKYPYSKDIEYKTHQANEIRKKYKMK